MHLRRRTNCCDPAVESEAERVIGPSDVTEKHPVFRFVNTPFFAEGVVSHYGRESASDRSPSCRKHQRGRGLRSIVDFNPYGSGEAPAREVGRGENSELQSVGSGNVRPASQDDPVTPAAHKRAIGVFSISVDEEF